MDAAGTHLRVDPASFGEFIMCARPLWTLLALGLILPGHLAGQVKSPTIPPAVSEDNRGDDARTILTRYAEAWRGQEELPLIEVPLTLGLEISGVGGGSYHVDLPLEGAGSLRDGPPSGAFQVIFETDIDFLRRLDRAELSAMTALGQARAGDPTPLVPRFPPGFRWTDEERAQMLPLIFHFWNREWPPVIRFGEGTTRRIHGGDLAVLYYDAGLRTGWGQVRPGMHINQDPRDQINPFPSLIIITRGVGTGRIGGREMILQEGQAVLIPAGMAHEFWATEDQYAECVMIMFGPGA
jgi:mannose-6-phosphate isomerase-like protein (cupin superfamily)